jgi:pilus assembly protein FimV
MKPHVKNRSLQHRLALAIPLLCTLESAAALGLGETQVNSVLNEPLQANVPVILAPGENYGAEQIQARLASAQAHNQAGLPYGNVLSDLKFEVVRGNGGQLILQIRSNRSLAEPLLNFLVDLNWEKGQLLREVSILLDPPYYRLPVEKQPVAAIRTQPVRPEETGRVASPNQSVLTTAPVRRPTASRPSRIKPGSYTVQPGDTLSGIAKAARRGTSLDMKDYMVAIYERNPQAFIDSMDHLLANAELSIPTADEVRSGVTMAPVVTTTPPETTPVPAVAQPQPVPEPPPVSQNQIETAEPRLEILPPDSIASSEAVTVEPGAGEVQAQSEQSLSAAGTTHPEMQVASNPLFMEVQSQLNDIQGENTQLRDENTLLAQRLDNTRSELSATREALQQIRQEMKSLVEVQSNATTSTTPKGLFGWLPWLLTALAVALLALFGLNRRKQAVPAMAGAMPKAPSFREYANLTESEIDRPNTALSTLKQAITDEDSLPESTGRFERSYGNIEDASTQMVSPPIIGNIPAVEEPSHTMDALQEAEIYLTYQQFALAEKTINKLLEEDPENTEYQLLKLRLLSETGKVDQMQNLSVELFRRFPDRSSDTHKRIQSICDRAFTATAGAASATAAAQKSASEGETAHERTWSGTGTSETFFNEEMTDFLSDATLSDTDPMLQKIADPSSELHSLDTIAVEDDDLTLPEYKQAADDINFIADDLTEQGLELPFDLETEILEEEERRIAVDRHSDDRQPENREKDD